MKASYQRDIIMDYFALRPADIKRLRPADWKRYKRQLMKICKDAEYPGAHYKFRIVLPMDKHRADAAGVCLFCGTWYSGDFKYKGYETSPGSVRQQRKRAEEKYV